MDLHHTATQDRMERDETTKNYGGDKHFCQKLTKS